MLDGAASGELEAGGESAYVELGGTDPASGSGGLFLGPGEGVFPGFFSEFF